jgi:hypothetical protein
LVEERESRRRDTRRLLKGQRRPRMPGEYGFISWEGVGNDY